MADPVYHNGSDGKVYIKPSGASAAFELDITKWDLTTSGNNKDVSGSKSGRKRIAGVPDATGTLTAHYDSANPQPDTTANTGPNLRAGSVVLLEMVEDGGASGQTDSFRLSAIIDTVKASSEFDGTIDYEVTYSLEDGSTLKYPGDS